MPERDPKASKVWLVGGGIASMAAAVFLIRDAGVPGPNIHILEELHIPGGALDGAPSPAQKGYVTRGGRMLEDEAYQTLWNLLETIPSLEDANVSVRQEIRDFNTRIKPYSKARLIGRDHKIIDASVYGFNTQDRLELLRILATPEHVLGARRIDDLFSDHFFETNFWQMWRTTFAFQNWHSAIELKRYFLRFIQESSRIHTLSGVRRTKYNQYDSIVRPIEKWLLDRGVDVRFGVRVVDADFDEADPSRRLLTRLYISDKSGPATIELAPGDVAMLTLGSITADATYGGNDTVPELTRDRRDGGWALWETLAKKAKDFGRPNTFDGNIDENKWESFTLTMHGDLLLKRIIAYSGNEPGTGGLMTFVDSGWLMSIVVPHQPHFPVMPADTYTLWGYGLFIDEVGDYVKKPMAKATGKEILTELLGQLGFDDIRDAVLASSDVTSVMMPYASALFSRRVPEDRPLVLPTGSANFAFLGQFVELPEDTVFTVEYSVHCAMHAAYHLFGVDKAIPPIYHGLMDPKVGLKALEAAFQ
ncbi:oleate hydratase [Methylovirgula ligni]|uniref:Oleate hydratase n=1 Tax=Methylovirgula ligni TaxID=569860 RepID=A0A3D9YNM2_9HYPH|nr:oleate hydratase [Methylovirgula ligni]QAY97390.1 oleate hydratase [Methylovirgula ligni]REF84105.1 oleate hydratase [Methylovirgula ligni]